MICMTLAECMASAEIFANFFYPSGPPLKFDCLWIDGDQSHFRVYYRWRQCWGNGGQSDRGPIPPQQQQPGRLCLPLFIWWRPPQWWGWRGPVEGPQCVHRQVESGGWGSHHREGQLHGDGGVRGSRLIHAAAVFSFGREVK